MSLRPQPDHVALAPGQRPLPGADQSLSGQSRQAAGTPKVLYLRPLSADHSLIRHIERFGQWNLQGSALGTLSLWGGSTVAVGVLLACGYWLATRVPPGPAGEAAPPPAIMIELAPEIAAPEIEVEGTDLAPESVEQTAQQQVEAPKPEEPLQEVPPDPPIEPPRPDPAEPLPAEPLPEELENPPDPTLPPEPEPDPVTELPEVEAPVVALRPPSRPANLQTTPPRQQATPSQQSTAAQQSAQRRVEAPVAQTATATQNVVNQTAPQISSQQWKSLALSHMDRFKRYPEQARAMGQQGSPQIRITFDAAGNVLAVEVVVSSGYPLLDQAAIDMAHRASPLPVPPLEISQHYTSTTFTPNFRIR